MEALILLAKWQPKIARIKTITLDKNDTKKLENQNVVKLSNCVIKIIS